MNTYLIPICDNGDNYIEKVIANGLSQAKERLYKELYDRFDWCESEDFENLVTELGAEGIYVGDFYDVAEFTDV